MMTDDPKYRFDEMDGFESVEVNTKVRVSYREIWMTVIRTHIVFTKEAQKTLFQRKFIRILYNKEKKQLMALSSPDAGKDTISVCPSAAKNGFSNFCLKELIEKELRYDLSMVKVSIPGRKSRSNPNGIIFDLTKAITSKPRRKEQK